MEKDQYLFGQQVMEVWYMMTVAVMATCQVSIHCPLGASQTWDSARTSVRSVYLLWPLSSLEVHIKSLAILTTRLPRSKWYVTLLISRLFCFSLY